MRPIVEVTMACLVDGCPGRVHVRATRRGRPVGVCDACEEVTRVILPAEEPAADRRTTPLLCGVAS